MLNFRCLYNQKIPGGEFVASPRQLKRRCYLRRGDEVKGVAQFIEAEGSSLGQQRGEANLKRVVSRNFFIFNGSTPGEVNLVALPCLQSLPATGRVR